MSFAKRLTVGALVGVLWLSMSPRLLPLPGERVAEFAQTSPEELPWLSDEENEALARLASPTAAAIWIEWSRTLILMLAGVIAAVALLRGYSWSLALMAITSGAFVALWGYRYGTHPLAGVIDVPDRGILVRLFQSWGDASFLSEYTGDPWYEVYFAYSEVALPLAHVCLVPLCMYWLWIWGGQSSVQRNANI